MAQRWTVAEAVKAIASGDAAARVDITKRFPLFATATDREILESMDYLTVRVVEKRYRAQLLGEDTGDESDDEESDGDGASSDGDDD